MGEAEGRNAGQRPRVRMAGAAAALMPLAVAGAQAEDAAAKTYVVTSKRGKGQGSLREAINRSDRHDGKDRIVFSSRLSGAIPVRRDLHASGPLVIAGYDEGDHNSVSGSIIAGNSAPVGPDCDAKEGPQAVSQGGNVFGPQGCGTPGPGDVLTADPLLGPLADNGGPTPTHALLPGSPAIDNGLDLGLKTDQRGVERERRPDSGSFEAR